MANNQTVKAEIVLMAALFYFRLDIVIREGKYNNWTVTGNGGGLGLGGGEDPDAKIVLYDIDMDTFMNTVCSAMLAGKAAVFFDSHSKCLGRCISQTGFGALTGGVSVKVKKP